MPDSEQKPPVPNVSESLWSHSAVLSSQVDFSGFSTMLAKDQLANTLCSLTASESRRYHKANGASSMAKHQYTILSMMKDEGHLLVDRVAYHKAYRL
jgi:hypothetical protein